MVLWSTLPLLLHVLRALLGIMIAIFFRPVARGGVGGVPTPPSGINDIHNFNYLIQERPFDCF